MAVRSDQHGRCKPDPLGCRGERPDRGDDVEHHGPVRVGAHAGLVRGVLRAQVAPHADVIREPERVVPEPVGELRELDRTHLLGLEPLEEEVALVAGKQTMRRHRQADIHGAGAQPSARSHVAAIESSRASSK